jgi:O-succinylbenzoic acid--CoA ligase
MHNLVDQFLQASFSLDGQTISNESIKKMATEVLANVTNALKTKSIVYLQDDNPMRFCITFFTLLDQGHAPIALAPDFNQFQKKQFLENKNRSWIENGNFIQVAIDGESEIVFPNSYACLTSGTTGTPKVCWLSIEGAKFNGSAHAKSFGMNENHYLLQSLPLYHSFGLSCYLWTVLELGCHLDFNSVFLGMKGLAKRELKNAVLYASPAQLKFMLKEKISEPIKGMSIISFGGGPADSKDILALKEKFTDVKTLVSYGLTEAGPRVSTGTIDTEKPSGFIGKAFKGITVKVLTNENELLEEGTGKLCILSPSNKQNRLEDETYNEYLLTRDVVVLKNNEICFQSREQDLIKVGGVSIYAKDIEDVVKQFEGISDCLITAKNHKMYGQIPVLIVEGEDCKTELMAYLKSKLSVLQMPKKFHFVEKFPRHSLDKINRKKLLELIGE